MTSYHLPDFPEYALVHEASLGEPKQLISYEAPFSLVKVSHPNDFSENEYYLQINSDQIFIVKSKQKWEVLKSGFSLEDLINGKKTSFYMLWPDVLEHLVEDTF